MFNHLATAAATSAILLAGASVDASLVVHYTFDETSGSTAADSAGVAQDGALLNAPTTPHWQPSGGIIGGAYSFAGSSENSAFSANVSTNTGPNGTLAAWLNTNGSGNNVAFSLAVGGSQFSQYIEVSAPSTARLKKRNGGDSTVASTTSVDDNNWHHVAGVFVWDDANGNGQVDVGENSERRIYVNGILESTQAETRSRINPSRIGVGGLVRGNNSSANDPFTGLIDDFGYWDDVVSDQMIALIHGLGRFSGVDLGDSAIDDVLAAWQAGAGNSATAGGEMWVYADGLTGVTGAIGGSVIGGNAFIVLDGNTGAGVALIPEPASLALLVLGGLAAFGWRRND